MTSRMAFAIGVSVLLLTGATLSACQHKTPEQRADWMVKKVTRELDLNDAQKAKLEDVKAEMLAARGQMESQHEMMYNEALAQLPSERLDQAKLLQLFEQHQAKMTQLAPAVLAKLAEFHASLTPEQKAKAAEELKEFHDRHHRH
jgi:periplasmic protein CpxP/Spy